MKECQEDLLSPNLWLALPSEFLGTLLITLLGCSTWTTGSDPNSIIVALTFGLTIASVVWVFSHISGGHVNPAVTLAALFTRRVSIIRGFLYIAAQIIGGITGAGMLYGLTPTAWQASNLGVNVVNADATSSQGFGVEMIATFLFVLTFFASQDNKRSDLQGSAPLTIGLAAVVCHLFALPVTKAGLNPARSFGPAVIAASWEHHWVFWVGPLVGGLLAGLMYEYIFAAGATCSGIKKCLLRTKRPRTVPEPEKAPLEEVKADGIEIDETKVDAPVEDGVEADPELGGEKGGEEQTPAE